jgi:hypothetical protein
MACRSESSGQNNIAEGVDSQGNGIGSCDGGGRLKCKTEVGTASPPLYSNSNGAAQNSKKNYHHQVFPALTVCLGEPQ